ncbi:hypothetical protein [Streptomyces roseolus]|uniref:hypothetical protein n=1 Tax=Streptomyces roseolus TaxID=67358 RepID=UPI001673A7F5|nr:hypothetical protein [Streptomyces roseolus]
MAVEEPAVAVGALQGVAVGEAFQGEAVVEAVVLVPVGVGDVAGAGEFPDGVGVDRGAEAFGEQVGGAGGAHVGQGSGGRADVCGAGRDGVDGGGSPASAVVGVGGRDESEVEGAVEAPLLEAQVGGQPLGNVVGLGLGHPWAPSS